MNKTSYLIFLNFARNGDIIEENLTIDDFYRNFEKLMEERKSIAYIRSLSGLSIFNQDVNYSTVCDNTNISRIQRFVVSLNIDSAEGNMRLFQQEYRFLKAKFSVIQLQSSTKDIPQWQIETTLTAPEMDADNCVIDILEPCFSDNCTPAQLGVCTIL
ncbi:hypothetical protein ACFORL_08690 [Legionella dresdenensis]|uniref:Uncharacterized protein n=1 Tax=Legionella dresdenensis TaxID=450200 RepID=A0ABV8CG10_9GAMM